MICPHCNGKGYTQEKPRVCPHCHCGHQHCCEGLQEQPDVYIGDPPACQRPYIGDVPSSVRVHYGLREKKRPYSVMCGGKHKAITNTPYDVVWEGSQEPVVVTSNQVHRSGYIKTRGVK